MLIGLCFGRWAAYMPGYTFEYTVSDDPDILFTWVKGNFKDRAGYPVEFKSQKCKYIRFHYVSEFLLLKIVLYASCMNHS